MTSVERCNQEADRCRALTSDESLTLSERVGAQRGELDWLIAGQMAQEDADRYDSFLFQKSQLGSLAGFKPIWIPDFLFDFQKVLTEWAIEKGAGAHFADCGLGKTPMSLVWSENVVRHTNKPVLYLTPLAVGAQAIREAEKFGIEAKRCSDGKVNGQAHTVITNYEKLHLFDPNDFGGVVCDESSILKSFDGTRRGEITEFMKKMRFRLLASATASPNDYHELGTQSEALGQLGYMDMLMRFFKNDQNTIRPMSYRHKGMDFNKLYDAAKWRFKGHAELPFFRWVCSWARACRRPSDLGFDDADFILPALIEKEHLVEARTLADGMLFALPAVGLKEQREERRRTLQERCEKVAALVANTGEQALIWCQLNEEGDTLERMIRGSVQVSGKDRDEAKEEKFLDFTRAKSRVVISKLKIGGWGLNFQNCAHVVTFPDHSFEGYYQGVRRCWRFGQKRSVRVDVVATEGQKSVLANLRRKGRASDKMFTRLVECMNDSLNIDRLKVHTEKVGLPPWL